MSQVFLFHASMIRWILVFKDSTSEAASPRRRCSQLDLDTPKPRRSEVRPRWKLVLDATLPARLIVLFELCQQEQSDRRLT